MSAVIRGLAVSAALALAATGVGQAADDGAPTWPKRLQGHGGPVRSVTLDAQDAQALTASFDYSVILWSIDAGEAKVLHRMIGHEAAANDASFAGGQRAVSVGDDGAVILWSLADGAMLDRVDTGDDKMLAVAVSSDGRFAVTASWDRTARIYALEGDRLTERTVLQGHRGTVNAVAFSGDGSQVYTASYDGTIRLFEREGGALLREVYAHGWAVNVMRLLPDGRHLVFGATDGAVAVVDIAQGEVVKQLASHERPVLSLALSGEGARLASGGGDGRIRVYATDGWEMLEEYANPYGPIWSLALSSEGAVALYAGLDDHVNVWQVAPRRAFEPVDSSFPRRFQVAEDEDPGRRQFARKCSVCHTLTADDGNRAGPTLYGVFGRRVGTLPGYPYSEALRRLDFIWNEQTISDLFDHGPDIVTPGSKMPLQRLTNDEERNALVAYLKRATAPDVSGSKREAERKQ